MYLTINQVLPIAQYSKASIYRMIDAGTFPQPVKLGPKKSVWRASDVEAWRLSKEAATPVFQADDDLEALLS